MICEECVENAHLIVMEEHGMTDEPKKKDGSSALSLKKPKEIKDFLSDHVMLRHNVVTGRCECHVIADDPWEDYDGSTESAMKVLMAAASSKLSTLRSALPLRSAKNTQLDWQPVTDRIVNSLWAKMSREKAVRVQDMYRVIESDYVPEYHPFRYYLEHLPPWNGHDDYLLELSASVLVRGDVEEQLLFAQYLKKWLVAMVAAWVDDSVVNNVILVLIGEQAETLSTAYIALGPQRYTVYIPSPMALEQFPEKIRNGEWAAMAIKFRKTAGEKTKLVNRIPMLEKELLAEYDAVREEARTLLKSGKRDAAVKLLNECYARQYARAEKLLTSLLAEAEAAQAKKTAAAK